MLQSIDGVVCLSPVPSYNRQTCTVFKARHVSLSVIPWLCPWVRPPKHVKFGTKVESGKYYPSPRNDKLPLKGRGQGHVTHLFHIVIRHTGSKQ